MTIKTNIKEAPVHLYCLLQDYK